MNTNLKNIPETFAPNYLATIMWKDDEGNAYRYALWNDVGEKFFFDVPLYAGQVIRKNFRFEIWTITGSIAVAQASVIQFLTSILQGIDYRYGTDTKLVADDGTVTNFGVSILAQATIPTAGLVGWFKADGNYIVDDGPVQSWSSHINPTDQLVWDGVNAPIKVTDPTVFNGHPYVDFTTGQLSGSHTSVLQTLFNATLGGATENELSLVFIVCKSLSNSSVALIFRLSDSGSVMIRQASLNNSVNSFGMNGFGFGQITQTGETLATLRLGDSFGALMSVPNAIDEVVVRGAEIPAAVVNSMILGKAPVQIAEILIYTSLASIADYNSIIQYIAQKYSNGYLYQLPFTFPTNSSPQSNVI